MKDYYEFQRSIIQHLAKMRLIVDAQAADVQRLQNEVDMLRSKMPEKAPEFKPIPLTPVAKFRAEVATKRSAALAAMEARVEVEEARVEVEEAEDTPAKVVDKTSKSEYYRRGYPMGDPRMIKTLLAIAQAIGSDHQVCARVLGGITGIPDSTTSKIIRDLRNLGHIVGGTINKTPVLLTDKGVCAIRRIQVSGIMATQ